MGGHAPSATPLHFGDVADPLFGWYHAPRPPRRRCGVVLCNPVDEEAAPARSALRRLAERLQDAGFAVLRFDFHGSGDSAGGPFEPGRVPGWLDDVGRAVDELRARGGVDEICLGGLRFAATLAAVAAAHRGDVDSLVLCSALLDGRAYVDERTRRDQTALFGGPTSATSADLAGIALPDGARPARQALLIDDGRLPSLADRLSRCGVATESLQRPGQELHVADQSDGRAGLLGEIVAWISSRHVDVAAAARPVRVPVAASVPATAAERLLAFGEHSQRFGILAPARRTSRESAEQRPAIVLVGDDGVHPVGSHRFHVDLARRWARLGFHVLRMERANGDGVAEVQVALAAFGAAVSVRRFVLVGPGAGADAACRTALHDRSVTGVVLINPRTPGVDAYEPLRRLWRRRRTAQSLPGCLRQMAERGVDTLLVASADASAIEGLDRLQHLRCIGVADGDRALASPLTQVLVATTITDHLVQRYLP